MSTEKTKKLADRLVIRKQAFNDLLTGYQNGIGSIIAEKESTAFQSLDGYEKELVRTAFAYEVRPDTTPRQVFDETYG